MSLGTIGRMLHGTRRKMLTIQAEEAAVSFRELFGLGSGDIIRLKFTGQRNNHFFKQCRIMEIDRCYYNSVGGHTALIKVCPLNFGGGLGCTRNVILVRERKGKITQMHGVEDPEVQVLQKMEQES